jgi:GNAT superfamily N-acetyltransferase
MTPSLRFESAEEADFDALLSLRITTMRASLEALGRFDATRARERFRSTFRPQHTRRIILGQAAAGCVATWPEAGMVRLEHFYIDPAHQGRGLGTAVVEALLREPAHAGKAFIVGALRGSAANRFYARHGFVKSAESEWDIEYVRPASTPEGRP